EGLVRGVVHGPVRGHGVPFSDEARSEWPRAPSFYRYRNPRRGFALAVEVLRLGSCRSGRVFEARRAAPGESVGPRRRASSTRPTRRPGALRSLLFLLLLRRGVLLAEVPGL